VIALRLSTDPTDTARADLRKCLTDYAVLEQANMFRRTLVPRLAGIAIVAALVNRRFRIGRDFSLVLAWLAAFSIAAFVVEWSCRRRFWTNSAPFRDDGTRGFSRAGFT
jgi:hypothetical protein